VPVAYEVASALNAPLDVIVVRKLGVPFQPELGMGAIGEDGERIFNDEVIRLAGVSDSEIAAVEARERAELERRARRFRGDRPPARVEGQTAVVVDDGIAVGSPARAACQFARAEGVARVVLARPVAPPGRRAHIGGDADECVSLDTPLEFFAIGRSYNDISQTSDDEVVDCLQRTARRTPVALRRWAPPAILPRATKRSRCGPARSGSAGTSPCPKPPVVWSSSPTAGAAAATALATATLPPC
jgi:putative phosphoribosyl transferase